MKKLFLIVLLLSQGIIAYAQQENAYVLRPTIWKTNTISVCWDNPNPGDEEMREAVRQAVKDTWEKYCGLQFTDWVPAYEKDCDIHISIEDDPDDGSHNNGPHTKALGNKLSHMPKGMVLNFTFNNWCPDCKIDKEGKESKESRIFSIKAIAAHEFGHAIGFAHEQNRKDCDFPNCFKKEQGTNGDWYISSCDRQSIMNYCNPDWNNNGFLSALDIQGARYLYGLPANQALAFEPLKLVHTSNSIAPIRGRRISHEFKVYVVGGDAALAKIDKVVYHLHPTFKNPDMTLQNREDNFGLGLRVWGEFETSADIYLKDGTKQTLTRYLDFAGNGTESEETGEFAPERKSNGRGNGKGINEAIPSKTSIR